MPQYDEFSKDKMVEICKDDEEIMSYLPDDIDRCRKRYLLVVLSTLKPYFVKSIVDHAKDQRSGVFTMHRAQGSDTLTLRAAMSITPEFQRKLCNATSEHRQAKGRLGRGLTDQINQACGLKKRKKKQARKLPILADLKTYNQATKTLSTMPD